MTRSTPEGDPFGEFGEFFGEEQNIVAATQNKISNQRNDDDGSKEYRDGIGHAAWNSLLGLSATWANVR